MKLFMVVTTVATEQDAQVMRDTILAKRLAACVQCDAITSHYHWAGARVNEAEVRMTCKTTAACRDTLVGYIAEQHPYEIPEILVFAVEATEAYGTWVAGEVNDGAS